MALQMNVNLRGGLTLNNCYVRVDRVWASKKVDDSGWSLMVDTYVYENKTERDKGKSAQMVTCPEVDRFKFDFDPAGADRLENLVAVAYEKLKTHDTFKGKTTDV